MIIKIAEGDLITKFGEYHEMLFYDGQKEYITLIMGDVGGRGRYCAEYILHACMLIISTVVNVTAGNKWNFRNN